MNGVLYQKKKTDKKKEEGSRDLLRQEVRQHDAGGAHPEWAQELVNDAVHVVERQGVEDDVIFGPRPLWNQTLDLMDETREERESVFRMNRSISFHCCRHLV